MDHVPIKTESAWKSADMGASWLRVLTPEERAALADMLVAVRATGKTILELTRDDVPLGAFAGVLPVLRHQLEHGVGFMTLRGAPSDHFSPDDNRLLFWSLGLHLGVARPQGRTSQLMSDVRADGGQDPGDGRAWL